MLQSLSGFSLPSPKNQKKDPIIRPIDEAVANKVYIIMTIDCQLADPSSFKEDFMYSL
jgi:hypothetical protein